MIVRLSMIVGLLVVCAFLYASIHWYGPALSTDPDTAAGSQAVTSRCPNGATGSFESDAPEKSRSQFLWEVRHGKPSPFTPLFHDAPDSYHIVKSDLAAGLLLDPDEAARLRAIVVVGPGGVLWSYDVIVVSGDVGALQVVRTHFAHARITAKSTNTTTSEAIRDLASVLGSSPHVIRSGPTVEELRSDLKRLCWGEFDYDLLVAFPTESGFAFRISSLEYAPDSFRQEVLAQVNDLIAGETFIYRHGERIPPAV